MFSSFANALNPGFIDLFIHVHLLFTMKVVNTICLGVPIYFKIVCGWSRDPSSGLLPLSIYHFPFSTNQCGISCSQLLGTKTTKIWCPS